MIYKNFDITDVFCTFFFFFTLFFFKIIVSMQVKYTFLYKYSQKPPLDLYYHQTLLIIHLNIILQICSKSHHHFHSLNSAELKP